MNSAASLTLKPFLFSVSRRPRGLLAWQVEPAEFAKIMHLMETRYGAADFTPEHSPAALRAGTYYLTRVDDLYRRSYERKDKENAANGFHV